MKLQRRLALTLVLVAAPIALGFTLYMTWGRERAVVDATLAATIERMEAGGRRRCEARVTRIQPRAGRGVRRARRPRGGRRAPRDAQGRRRGRPRQGRVRGLYDPSFHALSDDMPPLDAELARDLEGGQQAAGVFRGRRARIAMRMPWDGPCAVVVVDRSLGPWVSERGQLRSLGLAVAVVLVTASVALLALGPLVRRIRQLEGAVRGQAASGYGVDVPVEGSDEVADLARAFNSAGAQIRSRLAELSARDEALTTFLQGTTHDVMVPLTVLQGHLSALRADGLNDGKLDGAIEEAHYLAALLRNLSAAARLDAGEPMISRHDLDLGELVERVVSRHRPVARGRHVSLNFSIPERAIVVNADSTLLERMVGNLVHNAIRYNRRGGHVAVLLEPRDGGAGFRLTVRDDGPGIPAEELARVTERSFRGGEARQRRPTGLGLGLHIVRDVAERHRYQLRFKSPDEGGGLEVTIDGRR